MGSTDLPEPAAERPQSLYTFRDSAPFSLSVPLFHAYGVSVKLTHVVDIW
jgi:hypothetical protein